MLTGLHINRVITHRTIDLLQNADWNQKYEIIINHEILVETVLKKRV